MINPINYWYQKYLQEKKRADNLQSASKEMGNRIYFNPHTALYSHERQTEDDIEYICKNIVDEMLEVAEDHAYLAGSEAMRNKTVKWLEDELCAEKVNTLYPPMSIVISKSYESVDEFIQGFKKIN